MSCDRRKVATGVWRRSCHLLHLRPTRLRSYLGIYPHSGSSPKVQPPSLPFVPFALISYDSLTMTASDMWSFICALLSLILIPISLVTSSLASQFSLPADPFWQDVLDKERSFFHLPIHSHGLSLDCLGIPKSNSNQKCGNKVSKWVD
jgi:hypothetical protein